MNVLIGWDGYLQNVRKCHKKSFSRVTWHLPEAAWFREGAFLWLGGSLERHLTDISRDLALGIQSLKFVICLQVKLLIRPTLCYVLVVVACIWVKIGSSHKTPKQLLATTKTQLKSPGGLRMESCRVAVRCLSPWRHVFCLEDQGFPRVQCKPISREYLYRVGDSNCEKQLSTAWAKLEHMT